MYLYYATPSIRPKPYTNLININCFYINYCKTCCKVVNQYYTILKNYSRFVAINCVQYRTKNMIKLWFVNNFKNPFITYRCDNYCY